MIMVKRFIAKLAILFACFVIYFVVQSPKLLQHVVMKTNLSNPRDEVSVEVTRSKTLKKLGEEVRSIIHKFVSTKNRPRMCKQTTCGFGCSTHALVQCVISSLEHNRSFQIGYNPKGLSGPSFNNVFQPLPFVSDKNVSLTNWSMIVNSNNTNWIRSGVEDHYELNVIPKWIRQRVAELHPNPTAWWSGQIASILLQMKPRYLNLVDSFTDWEQPIVGVHIRRTDKLRQEMRFFSIEEYFYHVEVWYKKRDRELELLGKEGSVKRRVFLATDDPAVINETLTWKEGNERFRNYEVLYDKQSTYSALHVLGRKTEDAYKYIALDLARLAKCNFVVCTLTSNVCRLVFELLQVRHGDASPLMTSLDISYNFRRHIEPGKHQAVLAQVRDVLHPREASEGETGGEVIELRVGDILLPMKSYKMGAVWFGQNLRTRKSGFYFAHKVQPQFLVS